jgi:hypothetical protein
MPFRLSPAGRGPAERARIRAHTKRRLLRCAVEELEHRVLLSGSPTVYTVDSRTSTGAGSSNSGDLVYCINQANNNTNPAGSEITFDPAIFDLSEPGPTDIILTVALQLTETPGPEIILGPGPSETEIWSQPPSTAFGTPPTFQIKPGVTATLSGLSFYAGVCDINNDGTLTVSGCELGEGGEGIVNSGNLTVSQTTIVDGVGGELGGGIYNSGTLALVGSVLWDNYMIDDSMVDPSYGGGVYNDGTMTAVNSTFADNSSFYGGAIYTANPPGSLMKGSLTLVNCTIADNGQLTWTTGYGGGLDVAGGTAILDNTIVALNVGDGATEQPSDIVGNVSSTSAFNLIGTGGSGDLQNGVDGNHVGVSDPGVGPGPGIHGGSIYTIALSSGSPAIAAGSVALAVDPVTGLALTTDERGAGFPRTYNNTVDIGSFESFDPYTSSTTGSGLGSPNGPGSSELSGPAIVGEHVMTAGKGKHEHVTGFALVFSEVMNAATAGLATDYDVFSTAVKKTKKGTTATKKPVPFSVSYSSAKNVVTINVSSTKPFAKGGGITISGVSSQAGVLLSASDTVFTILARAKGIVPG